MGAIPQLHMRKTGMDQLPPLALPQHFALHSHTEGLAGVWEGLIEASFGSRHSFQDVIVNGGGYQPQYVLYISYKGVDIATATAVEKQTFPGEGWFRMVAAHPEARGLGAGKLVCLAALHSLAARGYNSVVLSTDDHRLPAICLYLSLGFAPLMTHESHEKRWQTVMENIHSDLPTLK